jgi:hypothetical protein
MCVNYANWVQKTSGVLQYQGGPCVNREGCNTATSSILGSKSGLYEGDICKQIMFRYDSLCVGIGWSENLRLLQ